MFSFLEKRIDCEGERVTRLELVISAWEARVLPLHYTRLFNLPACINSPILR